MLTCDLRLGRYQDVLADVECDLLCADTPFSPRVHEGQRTGSSTRKSTLTYDAWTELQAREFVEFWVKRTRWWFIAWSDHTMRHWYESALESLGWYVFAPVPWIREFPPPRLAADGPASAADYLTIARPRRSLPPERRGSRSGYYVVPHQNGQALADERWHPGGKTLEDVVRMLAEYSNPGDVVCDPTAGGGTTLLAARHLACAAIGSEAVEDTFETAARRLRIHAPTDEQVETIRKRREWEKRQEVVGRSMATARRTRDERRVDEQGDLPLFGGGA